MSARRLVLTAAAMWLIAVGLAALTPAPSVMTGVLTSPQHTVDTTGSDSLVVAAAGLLAWAAWGWGALGLALTATSALPGVLGTAARLAVCVVLPAGARRSAALALGLGIGVAAPLLGTTALVLATPASAAATASVPDWPADTAVPEWPASPTEDADPVPDRPGPAVPADAHVVVRGDCLWHIATTRLLQQSGRTPTDGEVAATAHAWWSTNADVIGPDPDLLLPGQVLRPPDPA
jgi:hypothetical protein